MCLAYYSPRKRAGRAHVPDAETPSIAPPGSHTGCRGSCPMPRISVTVENAARDEPTPSSAPPRGAGGGTARRRRLALRKPAPNPPCAFLKAKKIGGHRRPAFKIISLSYSQNLGVVPNHSQDARDTQDMLRHEHPNAMIMGDTARLEYKNIPWSRHAYRIL